MNTSNGDGQVKEGPLDALFRARARLAEVFVEREQAIDAVLAGLASGEPVILVAPPGTAKTQLVEALASMVGARYFYYLLTRFTEPDELLGPIDINALRQGRYERITRGRLPEAEIVFLDEVFKGSSAVRNLLLDIILHKRVMVGTGYQSIPMLAFYTASNEVSSDAEDQGFYDRLTIRSFYGYVSIDRWPDLLEKGGRLLLEGPREALAGPRVLDSGRVREIQEMARERARWMLERGEYTGKLLEALMELRQRGVDMTDRRKVKTLLVAAAFSLVYAEPQPSLDSLADALRVTAPSFPEDLEKVEEAIVRVGLSSYSYRVRQLQTLAAEVKSLRERAREYPTPDVVRGLEVVVEKASTVLSVTGDNPRLRPYSAALSRELDKARETLAERRGGDGG